MGLFVKPNILGEKALIQPDLFDGMASISVTLWKTFYSVSSLLLLVRVGNVGLVAVAWIDDGGFKSFQKQISVYCYKLLAHQYPQQ